MVNTCKYYKGGDEGIGGNTLLVDFLARPVVGGPSFWVYEYGLAPIPSSSSAKRFPLSPCPNSGASILRFFLEMGCSLEGEVCRWDRALGTTAVAAVSMSIGMEDEGEPGPDAGAAGMCLWMIISLFTMKCCALGGKRGGVGSGGGVGSNVRRRGAGQDNWDVGLTREEGEDKTILAPDQS